MPQNLDDAIPLGGLIFWNMGDVQRWADVNGGELAVRFAIAEGRFFAGAGMAQRWVDLQEHQRARDFASATMESNRRAATAAERAARYAMWSSLVSLVTVAVTVVSSCSATR